MAADIRKNPFAAPTSDGWMNNKVNCWKAKSMVGYANQQLSMGENHESSENKGSEL